MDEISTYTFDAEDRSGPVWEAVRCLVLRLKVPSEIAKQLADAAQQKTMSIYGTRRA